MKLLLIWICLFACFTGVSAQEELAKPRRGEGISAFLKRHGRSGNEHYQEFLRLNRERLHGKKELRLDTQYLLPPLKGKETANVTTAVRTGKNHHEPLFGPALADVSVTGNRLQGACFYVVSGHGGPDPGAIGKVGRMELHEDEYAYDVALRLARNLMQEGAEVHIIIQDAKDGIRNDSYLANSKRETCMGDPIPLNQMARLQQRCDKINALYAKDKKNSRYCRAIFIHLDSRGKGNRTDVFFYHAPGSTQGKRLADTMKRTFESKYDKHQPNRGFEGTVSSRGLYVLQNSAPVSVFVELGNIQNAFDQRRFILSSNRQALSKWLMEGFIADYQRSR